MNSEPFGVHSVHPVYLSECIGTAGTNVWDGDGNAPGTASLCLRPAPAARQIAHVPCGGRGSSPRKRSLPGHISFLCEAGLRLLSSLVLPLGE